MKKFSHNIIHIYGDKGSRWLSELSILITELELFWNLCDLNLECTVPGNSLKSYFPEKDSRQQKLLVTLW